MKRRKGAFSGWLKLCEGPRLVHIGPRSCAWSIFVLSVGAALVFGCAQQSGARGSAANSSMEGTALGGGNSQVSESGMGGAFASGVGGSPNGSVTGGASSGSGGNNSASGAVTACGPNGYTLRRLTRAEYNNTVRDIAGDTSQPGNAFPADVIGGGFANNIENASVSLIHVEQMELAARSVVAGAFSRGQFTSCTTRDCVAQEVARVGRQAWRRALTASEQQGLLAFFDNQAALGNSLDEAFQATLTAVLLAPEFVFRVDTSPDGVKLDDISLAGRISYSLWASTPDATLLTAAESGKLATTAGIESEVRRMLADPKANALVDSFASEWLGLYNVGGINPDPKVFGTISPMLKQAMRQESMLFFQSFLLEPKNALDLLGTNFTFLNDELAQHYQVTVPGSATLVSVPANATRGAGLLAQASVLSITSASTRTSPVKRGKWVLSALLCSEPPPPPANVPPLPEVQNGSGLSLRALAEQHRAAPACAGCHSLLDPIGFGLENFDAVGRYREVDNGQPIDASGEISGVAFDGHQGLIQLLKADPRFPACISEKLLTYALARPLNQAHNPAKQALVTSFAASNFSLREQLVNTALEPAFRTLCGAL
ncbi:MAG: DUF1592 domain-containing protein [Polyangiaceae bacterium]|nr:DUF1592 domain-containing protein [Polyangiaceae bacterium]